MIAQYTAHSISRCLEQTAPAVYRAKLKQRQMRKFRESMHHRAYHHGHDRFGGFSPWNNPMSKIWFHHSPSWLYSRYFSSFSPHVLTRYSPHTFNANHLYGLTVKPASQFAYRTFFSAATGFFNRERRSVGRLFGQSFQASEAFATKAQNIYNMNKSQKFIHSYGKPLKPIDVLKSNWKNRNTRPTNLRAKPFNQPSFVFPQSSLYSTFHTSSFSSESSIPSLRELTRRFHITPDVGSYVDFDMSPTITVPAVTQLSSDIVERLTEDIEHHIAQLRSMADNLKKLAFLGELPMSVEDCSLRVYFPNCEPDQVNSLLNSAEVTQGVIRSHNDSNIVSPATSLNSESSFYTGSTNSFSSFPLSASQDGTRTPELESSGFYYSGEMESVSRRNSTSSEIWDIARLRGFSSGSEVSHSLVMASLTNASSGETVSEGSSVLFSV